MNDQIKVLLCEGHEHEAHVFTCDSEMYHYTMWKTRCGYSLAPPACGLWSIRRRAHDPAFQGLDDFAGSITVTSDPAIYLGNGLPFVLSDALRFEVDNILLYAMQAEITRVLAPHGID
jgi:hypothetical protein